MATTPMKICCSYSCDPTPVHCNTVFGNKQSPLSSVAELNRLPAGLCHGNYTLKDLLFIQLFYNPTPVHCNTVFGNKQSPLSRAAEQNRLPAGFWHGKCTLTDLLFIQLCSDQHQCTATIFLGTSKHHSPMLLS